MKRNIAYVHKMLNWKAFIINICTNAIGTIFGMKNAMFWGLRLRQHSLSLSPVSGGKIGSTGAPDEGFSVTWMPNQIEKCVWIGQNNRYSLVWKYQYLHCRAARISGPCDYDGTPQLGCLHVSTLLCLWGLVHGVQAQRNHSFQW